MKKKGKFGLPLTIAVYLTLLVAVACVNQRRVRELAQSNVSAGAAIIEEMRPPEIYGDTLVSDVNSLKPVSLKDSDKPFVMNAILDEKTGEMVAVDNLNPVVVEAKFRNIAERGGKINMSFEISVPQKMQNTSWQVRLRPKFIYLGDTLKGDEFYVTGKRYRDIQLRGYQLYDKYLKSIITDSCDYLKNFTRYKQMHRFISRNFPKIYALRNDTSIVKDTGTSGLYDISLKETVEHYKKHSLIALNNRKREALPDIFSRYIKDPIKKEGVRLDSVITGEDGTIKYCYRQTIDAESGLKKIQMIISGGIFKEGQRVYEIPETQPLSFYVSSLTYFADNTPLYVDAGNFGTMVDTLYMQGIAALDSREYKKAIEILAPYNNINTAVAFLCADNNKLALDLLQRLPQSAKRDYMLALAYMRMNQSDKAVEFFKRSVELDPYMKHRGNLDPEIYALIDKYKLNQTL